MNIKLNMTWFLIFNRTHSICINEIEDFLKHDSSNFKLKIVEKKDKYRKLEKKEKSLIKKYIKCLTGYSDIQLSRLIVFFLKKRLFFSKSAVKT